MPNELSREARDLIEHDLTTTIHVGARPLTIPEWHALLTENGFRITDCATAPMHLLELPGLIQDEGLGRVLLIAGNLLCDSKTRERIFAMKSIFRKHTSHLRAITIVAAKNFDGG